MADRGTKLSDRFQAISELTLDEIWSLVDDLIAAHGDYIPPLH